MKTIWFFTTYGARYKAEIPDEIESLPSLMIGNKCACQGTVVALDYTTKLSTCSNGEKRLFPTWFKQVDDEHAAPQLLVFKDCRVVGRFYFEKTT